MAARRPFWKWHRWKSIGFCLWPPSMKFEIEIPKQTWLMLRKPCRLQTDGRTDGQTDGQGESSIYYTPSNFVGRGYNNRFRGVIHLPGSEPFPLMLIFPMGFSILVRTQIAKFIGPTWGPPGSCWPQMGPMLAPWTLLSGKISYIEKALWSITTWHCMQHGGCRQRYNRSGKQRCLPQSHRDILHHKIKKM